ncbi:hypothetical protein EJ04DRAFT_196917 [Polyplosphaeria fusca]|uniref:Uncharacterized protein n=1 Tax=Polyplosphaeria fusca TaxID=682080 RepID=A0A9P4R7J4_9PLEO|nr:hypothetical protein EJ04DRAFT_196917 [Polyplosphaeria fusca]
MQRQLFSKHPPSLSAQSIMIACRWTRPCSWPWRRDRPAAEGADGHVGCLETFSPIQRPPWAARGRTMTPAGALWHAMQKRRIVSAARGATVTPRTRPRNRSGGAVSGRRPTSYQATQACPPAAIRRRRRARFHAEIQTRATPRSTTAAHCCRNVVVRPSPSLICLAGCNFFSLSPSAARPWCDDSLQTALHVVVVAAVAASWWRVRVPHGWPAGRLLSLCSRPDAVPAFQLPSHAAQSCHLSLLVRVVG